ncbi:transaldolase [Nitriliruptoraceae bacterium ZYF776]|nr:transaldolase [Profundirhabdus halotolerans]
MLFLDSAVRDDVAPLLATGLFDGVTTNPKVLDQAGVRAEDVPAFYAWAREQGAGTVFVQATGRDVVELRRTSAAILELGDAVRVKLVATTAGLTVARELADAGHEVLVTAVYHPAQGLAAMAAGARYLAPYVGRAGDAGRDGTALVAQLARIVAAAGSDLRILAASLRGADAVADASAAGAHDVTISVPVARELLDDTLTHVAADEFERLAVGA